MCNRAIASFTGGVGGVFPSYRQTRCCGIVACMPSPSVQACERAPEQITIMCRTLASPFSAASSSSPSTVFAEVGQRPSAQPGASPCLRRNKSPSACDRYASPPDSPASLFSARRSGGCRRSLYDRRRGTNLTAAKRELKGLSFYAIAFVVKIQRFDGSQHDL